MPNMGYCRFQNTLQDLRDCKEHLDDTVSPEEEKARTQLINPCMRIADIYREDEED